MIAWFRQIDNAKSPFEVVAVARDYFASWSPQELALLPEPCRPGKLRDETDIDNLHSKLVEEYRNTRVSGDALDALQRLTSFLVRASIRIADIADGQAKSGAGSPSTGPMKSAASRGS
jgi:hypothetical protein